MSDLNSRDFRNACPLQNDYSNLSSGMDLVLMENWREIFCKCLDCLQYFKDGRLEFLLKEEEIWEPELDPKAQMDPFELGVEQLSRLDRTIALEGVHAFEELKKELYEKLLIPAIQNQQVVSEYQIRDFFEDLIMSRQRNQT